jgi:hypothetical protein
MRIRRILATGLIAVLVGSVLSVIGLAAPAQAANACRQAASSTVWDLEDSVRYEGRVVMKNYSSRYNACSKIVVKHKRGKKIDVTLRVRKNFDDPDKQTTEKVVDYPNRKVVRTYYLTKNREIDITAWWRRASSDGDYKYVGTTTLRKT